MQVFKLYMKILNKHKGQIIMYVCIFAGLMFGIILPNSGKQESVNFTESTTKYAIFDYDNSEISKSVGEFLESNHELVEIKDDEKETIQDAMYNQKVACVVRIYEGYEKAFLEGNGSEKLEVYKINGTTKSMLLEEDLNGFIKVLKTYVEADYDIEEAIEHTNKAGETKVEVLLPDGEEIKEQSPSQFFFTYQPWMFIAMCVCGITPVLIILDKKIVRERIQCSSYKFSRMNGEILLGVLATGFSICALFAVAGIAIFYKEMSVTQGILYVINMFCIMAVALAITFLVGKVTTKEQVVSMLANVVSLGMAFLSGVFVPMEFLSDTIIKIAHFLPAYWYELAVIEINTYKSDKLYQILGYMGVQLVFALVIVIAGFAVSRKRVLHKGA